MSGSASNVAGKTVDMVRVALGVSGLVAIVLGTIIVLNPGESGMVMMKIVAITFAVLAILAGLVYLARAALERSLSGGKRFWRGLLGVVYIAAGVVIFMNLSASAAVLAVFVSVSVGFAWIIEGILAFTVLKEARSKVWFVIYAVMSIIAGLMLVFSPWIGAVTLWLLLGIAMLVMGVLQVIRAFTVKEELGVEGETIVV